MVERRREPFWVQVTPYMLALLSLIAGVSSWALSTQADQDKKIVAMQEHIATTDQFITETLKEMKQDLRDIKKALK